VSDVIELRDVRFRAIVGVLETERHTPQLLSLDLDLERSFAAAIVSDDVADTTNYAEVLTLAVTVATEGAFFLLESLAGAVATAALNYDDALSAVEVAVRKLEPPVAEDVASVGVRLRRSRA